MSTSCDHDLSVRISPPDENGIQHMQCGECLADLGTLN